MKRPSLQTTRLVRQATEAIKAEARLPRLDALYTTLERDEFLRESNAIEGVRDEASYRQALVAWQHLIKQKGKLTQSVVLQTHKLLMRNQPIAGYLRGYFRDCAVYIGDRTGTNHRHVPLAIQQWLGHMATYPADKWKELHVEYERIHPFIDGNGRTGRMFMNWFRLKHGLPLLIIRTGGEQREYYSWFKKENERKPVKRFARYL